MSSPDCAVNASAIRLGDESRETLALAFDNLRYNVEDNKDDNDNKKVALAFKTRMTMITRRSTMTRQG